MAPLLQYVDAHSVWIEVLPLIILKTALPYCLLQGDALGGQNLSLPHPALVSVGFRDIWANSV